MNRNTFLLIAYICLLTLASKEMRGQTNESSVITWFQYKGKLPLREHLSLILDFQHRRQKFISETSQHVLRPGLNIQLKNRVNITLGTAVFWHSIAEGASALRLELRPYTFLEWKQPLGKATIFHRSRFELRYNRKTVGLASVDGFNFNYRAGHKLGIAIPIGASEIKNWQLEFYDEVLINFGKRITVNHLDQNRIYIGLKRTLNKSTSIKLGYMYIFLPTSDPDATATQHILVLGIGHDW